MKDAYTDPVEAQRALQEKIITPQKRHMATVEMQQLLQSMSADGLALDEAELILSEAINDATGWARARQGDGA